MIEAGGTMEAIQGATKLPAQLHSSVVTIGNFDGVHLAHRELFQSVVTAARRLHVPAVALTFDPHPAQILFPGRAPAILTPFEAKRSLIARSGIDLLWAMPFNEEIARLSADEFVRRFLVEQLHAAEVQVGENFSFGYKRLGNVQVLVELGRKCGFLVTALPLVYARGQKVSSSRIRQLLSEGKVELANRLLDRPFSVEGKIVEGSGVGREQTVPTLNLAPVPQQLPASGVYATHTWVAGYGFNSVTNVGHKPTFGPHPLTIESHLLNSQGRFSADHMRIEFLHRLRDERQFSDAAALKAQILKDVQRSLRYFTLMSRLVRASSLNVGVQQKDS